MARVLAIAYGNPLRGDDGLAWHAAEQLKQEGSPGMEIICVHQLTPELAEPLGRVDAVIFIDATQNEEAGVLACERVTSAPGEIRFSHQLTPAQLVSMAERLYGARPRAFCVSMGGASFEHGESLSPQVHQAMPQLIKTVKALCEEMVEDVRQAHLASSY